MGGVVKAAAWAPVQRLRPFVVAASVAMCSLFPRQESG